MKKRLKVLKAMRGSASRTGSGTHRYNRWRTFGMTVSLGILLAVPLSGLARVDLWSGRHYLLFEPTDFKRGLAGVIVGISAMYVVTFLTNVVAGRMFCGWGCPVGQVSRFGEAVDTPGLTRRQKWWASLKGASFSLLFVVSMLAWWVDLRVLWQGSPVALAWSWSALASGVIWSYVHGRYWRWEFCKTACPIGIYYTFMSPTRWYGVYFRNGRETCIECNACDNVCPVDLAPRELMTPIPARAGLSIAGAPGRNHCLECGDCVRACEWIIGVKGEEPVPLLLGFYSGPQRETVPKSKSSAAIVFLALLFAGCAVTPTAREIAIDVRPAPPGLARAEHVVLLTIDGLRADAIAAETAPVLHRLLGESAYSLRAQTVSPSVTLPAHASMLTGLTPDEHGVRWNSFEPRRGRIQVRTVFDVAHDAGMKTALFVGKDKLWHVATPRAIDRVSVRESTDLDVLAEALPFLVEERPHLTLIHLPDVDRIGHWSGWSGRGQLQVLLNTDALVGRLIKQLRRLRERESWALIVTADHGGDAFHHDRTRLNNTTVPWIVWGDGVTPRELPPVSVTATAGTILQALGLCESAREVSTCRPAR